MISRTAISRSFSTLSGMAARRSVIPARSLVSAQLGPARTLVRPNAISFTSHRCYSPQPRLREEENQYDESDASALDVAATEEKKVDLIPFESLRGYISFNTLRALTFKPFTLSAMSEVQRRVLHRMPYLAGGKLSSIARQSEEDGQLVNNPDAEEDSEGMQRGREDLLVKAKTGTGKTLAFLIPAIEARINSLEQLKRQPDEDGVVPTPSQQGMLARQASRSHVGTLIITPTRELATQIANEALKVCTWHKQMEVRLLVGGASRSLQLRDWRRGRKDIVVATPGRLRDLLSEPDVADALGKTDLLILDEADTLLEMGFSNDLNFIVDHLPKSRQTFLFSATVSKEIAAVAKKTLKPNHTVIDCVPKNESNVHLHVPQFYTTLQSSADQIPHILRLIAHDQLTNPKSKIVLFLPTTKLTMLFATFIRQLMYTLPNRTSVHEIHSRLDQNQRSRASERFRRVEEPSVLVTSDVSARGVDYPKVTRVVQIGVPSSTDQYIHRVGRTGRGGRLGGRGDIVLLPFEGGFIKNIGDIPIKPLATEELTEEIQQLALQQGRDEYTEKLQMIDDKVRALMPSLDPAAIEEVYTSMIGYYFPKSGLVGTTTIDVYEGLKDWSTESVGLPEPPYLSPSFLSKVGLHGQGGRKGDRVRGGNRGYGPSGGGFSGGRGRSSGDRPAFGGADRSAVRGFGGQERRGGGVYERRSGGGGFDAGYSRDRGDRAPREGWSGRGATFKGGFSDYMSG